MIFCPARLIDAILEKSVIHMYRLIRKYTAIRSRYIGKNPIAFLIFEKSAATRKFRKAQIIVPRTMILGSPPNELLSTFQSPSPAKTVQATARITTNAGHSFRDSRSSPLFTLLCRRSLLVTVFLRTLSSRTVLRVLSRVISDGTLRHEGGVL